MWASRWCKTGYGDTRVLTASGAVPTVATHGAKAPPSAASQHTPQVAQHAAALAGLACADKAVQIY